LGADAHLLGANNLFFTSQINHEWSSAAVALKDGLTTSFNVYQLNYQFAPMSIVTSNNATGASSTTTSSYNPSIKDQKMLSAHLTFSTSRWWAKGLGFSFVAPFPEVAQIDSGPILLPHHPWYEDSLHKTEFRTTMAQKWSQEWSSALSLNILWNADAQTDMITGINSSTTHSQGRIQAELKPTVSINLSLLYHLNTENDFLLEYASEVSQELTNHVTGTAPLGGSTSVNYSFEMKSLMAYEPLRLKITWAQKNLALALTYEDWSGYTPSDLTILKTLGIIQGSERYETVTGKKIVSPTAGYTWLLDHWNHTLSYRYLPKVFTIDQHLGGNTLDNNKHALGYTAEYFFNSSKDQSLSFGCQYHYLVKESSVKSSGQENGEAGVKIGSPGYNSQGYFLALALGLNWKY
jgi:hypothetical protein